MRKIVLLCLTISLGIALPCLAQEERTDITRTTNNRFKGADPLFDITANGARAVLINSDHDSHNIKGFCNGTSRIGHFLSKW